MHSHRLEALPAVLDFITAGNATFTLVSQKTGARFTYRARVAKDNPNLWFVAVLTGNDNESAYSYLGIIRGVGDTLTFNRTTKSKVGVAAPSSLGAVWFFGKVFGGVMPDDVEFWHEGKCGRCGRKLTVPRSIEMGIGPECESRITRIAA